MRHFMEKRCIVVLLSLVVILYGTCFASETEKININTASVEQLMKLNRVGAKYAQRIVEYRQKEGPFKTPEDIMKVPGIGQKTWEANKDRIEV